MPFLASITPCLGSRAGEHAERCLHVCERGIFLSFKNSIFFRACMRGLVFL